MNKFGHLKKLEVKGREVRYTIYQVEGEPTLIMKPATEANKPYFNAVLRRSKKNMRAINAGSVNSGIIAENREEDRNLFPKHVITGWEDVTDSSGEPVPYTEEDCRDYLEALPDWVFDDVRAFASNPAQISQALAEEEGAKK